MKKLKEQAWRGCVKTGEYLGSRLIVAGLVSVIFPLIFWLLRKIFATKMDQVAIVSIAVTLTYALIVGGIFVVKFIEVGKVMRREKQIKLKLSSLGPSQADALLALVEGTQPPAEVERVLEEHSLIERDYLKGWKIAPQSKDLILKWAEDRNRKRRQTP
jgi:hypothetical protein